MPKSNREYFGLSAPGKMGLNEKRVTDFEESTTGQHRYQTESPEQIIHVRKALMQMASSPPER